MNIGCIAHGVNLYDFLITAKILKYIIPFNSIDQLARLLLQSSSIENSNQ
jgi:hypothetical protein